LSVLQWVGACDGLTVPSEPHAAGISEYYVIPPLGNGPIFDRFYLGSRAGSVWR
jgi:hypothetical protein